MECTSTESNISSVMKDSLPSASYSLSNGHQWFPERIRSRAENITGWNSVTMQVYVKIWTYFKVLKVDDLTQLRSHIQSPIATKPFVFLQAVVNFMVCSIAKLRAIYAIWPRYLHIVFQNSQSLWNTRKTPVTCTKHSVVLVKLACFSKSVEHNDTCCWIINWWVHSIQPYSNEVMANGHHNGGPSGK